MEGKTPKKPRVKVPNAIDLGGEPGGNEFTDQRNYKQPSAPASNSKVPRIAVLVGVGLVVLVLLISGISKIFSANNSISSDTLDDLPVVKNAGATQFIDNQHEIINCFRQAVAGLEEEGFTNVTAYAQSRIDSYEYMVRGFDASLSAGEKQALIYDEVIKLYCGLNNIGVPIENCLDGYSADQCL